VPAVELPVYRSLSIGLPSKRISRILEEFDPDVVHLAAPVVLGAAGGHAAHSLGIPTVAVYQTDLAGFARRYRLGHASPIIWRWLRWVHAHADLTLAPSTLAAWELANHGIGPIARWGRGVDLQRFNPRHRSPLLRRRLAPGGEVLVGYVGRLAAEKQVHQLVHVSNLARTRLVIVGDGPCRAKLERQLPWAQFLGFKSGIELSQTIASLDVFLHTGVDETFCQAIQEALASGVPVVAPASGGPVDLVRHGVNGWLFPGDEPALMRGAVAELVANATLRQTMSRAARESVEQRDWESLGDELLAHYRRLCGIGDESWRVA
jgi:phosphatidylinositol alpha 1,6-mannosyltransferase